MTDRNVQYPYRFHVRPVPGTDDICEIIPAPGTVYEDGTFWNKQNVLKDATAALYGKTADAVPDDILAAIRPLITAAQNTANGKAKIVCGTYNGTTLASSVEYGTLEAQSINVGFNPLAVIVSYRGYISGVSMGLTSNTVGAPEGFGIALKNNPIIGKYYLDSSNIEQFIPLEITNTGFTVRSGTVKTGNYTKGLSGYNTEGKYYYIAIG